MQVTKTFTFHAAHRDVRAVDQCGNLHGHTYRLELSVRGEQDGDMLIHGDVLKMIYRERIEPVVEHQYLNERVHFNPTMENMAAWCQGQLVDGILRHFGVKEERSLYACTVVLWETPTMRAAYP